MKVRLGHVTNSSSSSFVIGKKTEEWTVDLVYKKIRELYLTYIDKIQTIGNLAKENDLGFELQERPWNKDQPEYTYFEFRSTNGESIWKNPNRESIEEKYGIEISYDYYKSNDLNWLKCESYEAYENYWIDVIKNNKKGDWKSYAPFTIYNLYEPGTVKMLHDGSIKEEDKFNNGTTEGILYWYHDYAVEYLEHNGKCSRCHCNEWCTNQTECKTEIKKYRKMDLKNKNIHLELLGRVCVASESGYIANYVVEELKELSRYSCNHMG